MVRPSASGGWRFSCSSFGVGPPSLCCGLWMVVRRTNSWSAPRDRGRLWFTYRTSQASTSRWICDYRGHEAAIQKEVSQRSGVDHSCGRQPTDLGKGTQDGDRHSRVGGRPRGPRAGRRRASGSCMEGRLEGHYRQMIISRKNVMFCVQVRDFTLLYNRGFVMYMYFAME